ncbi:MAG TPA: hypothetical protein VNN55_02245 [bacterium]|nr:hypothetical protein [bacterium]
MKKFAIALFALTLLSVAGTANAEMGVGVVWSGNGIVPNMVLPIKMASGLVIEPILGFDKSETDIPYIDEDEVPADFDLSITNIRAGVRVEKQMKMDGITPVFGGMAMIDLWSPGGDLSDEIDSWTNFSFGVYVGASAPLAEGVDLVGTWGPTITSFGEIKAADDDEIVLQESATNIGSTANLSLRFWIW